MLKTVPNNQIKAEVSEALVTDKQIAIGNTALQML